MPESGTSRMMIEMARLPFRRALQRVVELALASSVGVAACTESDSSEATNIERKSGDYDSGAPVHVDASDAPEASAPDLFADEETFACDEPLAPLLANLHPQVPTDFLELRVFRGLGDGGIGTIEPVESVGTPCASATDPASCATTLDVARNDAWGFRADGDQVGPGSYAVHQFLLFSRGDEVGALRTPLDIARFLGSLDGFGEARLLVQSANAPLACTGTPARTGWRQNADGTFEFLVSGTECGTLKYRRRYHVAKDGTVRLIARDPQFATMMVCGRRPDGLRAFTACDGGIGAHFARAAHLEAASVVAFRHLERDLRRLGAPKELIARARRSRHDEIRHAEATSLLARRFGATVPNVEVAPYTPRDAFDVAYENAVEGTIRETYGALVAAFQAESAAPELRPLLRSIAHDEARHAELAWDVARWLDTVLSADERRRLEDSKAHAMAELREWVVRTIEDAEVVRFAGLPRPQEALLLLDGLDGVRRSAA